MDSPADAHDARFCAEAGPASAHDAGWLLLATCAMDGPAHAYDARLLLATCAMDGPAHAYDARLLLGLVQWTARLVVAQLVLVLLAPAGHLLNGRRS